LFIYFKEAKVGKENLTEWLRGHAEEVLAEIGIKKSQTVLDFGCGSGLYAIPAAQLVGEEGKVYALDKNEEALKAVLENAKKSGLRNVKTIYSDTLKTGLDDEAVDVVLLYDVVHLIEDRTTLFSEIRRILKSEGVVSIYPMHVKMDEIKEQMQESGFSLRDEKYEGNILNFVNVRS